MTRQNCCLQNGMGEILMKRAKFGISAKFNILVVTVLLVLAIVNCIVIKIKVTESIEKAALEKAKTDLVLSYETVDKWVSGDWKLDGDKLYKGETLINDNFDIVDRIAKITGGTVTIFREDTRVTTNVVLDGKRAVGTQANPAVVDQTIKKGEKFYGEVDVAGHKYQTAYMPIKDASGAIIGMFYVGASQGLIDELVGSLLFQMIIILIVLSAIASLVVYVFTSRFKKRLDKVASALEFAGHGDFTHDVVDNTGDEISSLADSFKNMRNEMKELLNAVKVSSEEVSSSSEELSAIVDETSSATDSIANSITEIASSTDEQVNHSEMVKESVSNINGQIIKISDLSNEVKKASVQNAVKAQKGSEVIELTIKQVGLIHDKTSNTSKLVNSLGNKSKEIGKIIHMITEIAGQTNLLALNAAIEAARAGEHGRGFAVVADEVRKLAEQSSQSASQISSLVQEIQKDIELSVSSMSEGASAIDEGINLASNAGESFKSIQVSINDVSNQIDDVSEFIKDINGSVASMTKVINETAEIVEQNALSTQNVAASAQQQNASVEEIAAAANELSQLADNLQDMLGKFKV
ncbi:MAG: methyl-accepting chemotaxis sensory transducer [Bacillales bacterium]|nr:methyl-accepting chemotaxis sensory transducer [Bacillales bacterium]